LLARHRSPPQLKNPLKPMTPEAPQLAADG